jgi:hypothetical protein
MYSTGVGLVLNGFGGNEGRGVGKMKELRHHRRRK